MLDTFQSIRHDPNTEKLSNIQTHISHNDPRLGFISIVQWFISKASPLSEVTGVEDQGTKFGSIRESARMFLPLSRAFLPNAGPVDSLSAALVETRVHSVRCEGITADQLPGQHSQR